jgi:hypothetical protein
MHATLLARLVVGLRTALRVHTYSGERQNQRDHEPTRMPPNTACTRRCWRSPQPGRDLPWPVLPPAIPLPTPASSARNATVRRAAPRRRKAHQQRWVARGGVMPYPPGAGRLARRVVAANPRPLGR